MIPKVLLHCPYDGEEKTTSDIFEFASSKIKTDPTNFLQSQSTKHRIVSSQCNDVLDQNCFANSKKLINSKSESRSPVNFYQVLPTNFQCIADASSSYTGNDSGHSSDCETEELDIFKCDSQLFDKAKIQSLPENNTFQLDSEVESNVIPSAGFLQSKLSSDSLFSNESSESNNISETTELLIEGQHMNQINTVVDIENENSKIKLLDSFPEIFESNIKTSQNNSIKSNNTIIFQCKENASELFFTASNNKDISSTVSLATSSSQHGIDFTRGKPSTMPIFLSSATTNAMLPPNSILGKVLQSQCSTLSVIEAYSSFCDLIALVGESRAVELLAKVPGEESVGDCVGIRQCLKDWTISKTKRSKILSMNKIGSNVNNCNGSVQEKVFNINKANINKFGAISSANTENSHQNENNDLIDKTVNSDEKCSLHNKILVHSDSFKIDPSLMKLSQNNFHKSVNDVSSAENKITDGLCPQNNCQCDFPCKILGLMHSTCFCKNARKCSCHVSLSNNYDDNCVKNCTKLSTCSKNFGGESHLYVMKEKSNEESLFHSVLKVEKNDSFDSIKDESQPNCKFYSFNEDECVTSNCYVRFNNEGHQFIYKDNDKLNCNYCACNSSVSDCQVNNTVCVSNQYIKKCIKPKKQLPGEKLSEVNFKRKICLPECCLSSTLTDNISNYHNLNKAATQDGTKCIDPKIEVLVQNLQEFLRSLTFKDCSLMLLISGPYISEVKSIIDLQQEPLFGNIAGDYRQSACNDPLSSMFKVITSQESISTLPSNGDAIQLDNTDRKKVTYYFCRVTVIDVVSKDPNKVSHHLEAVQKLTKIMLSRKLAGLKIPKCCSC